MKIFNLVLGILLVAQLILSAVLLWPRTSASTTAGPLLAGFSAADVVSLTVRDNEENQIVLAKGSDGWTLPEADDFPAQADKIDPVLEKVGKLVSSRMVTKTDSSHKRLQVASDDFNRMLDLEMADGSRHKLYVGSSAGAGATHVRADDRPEVYLTAGLEPWDTNTQAGSWIDTLYVSAPQTATVSLKLENGSGTFEFDRNGEDWTLAGLADGEEFNNGTFSTLLGQATGMRMAAPLGKEDKPEYGMEAPQAELTVSTDMEGEARTYTVLVGAKDEEGNYIIKSSESPYYVRVSGYLGDSFVDKTRDDFIMPPATPETVGLGGEVPVDVEGLFGAVPEEPAAAVEGDAAATPETPASGEPGVTVTPDETPAASGEETPAATPETVLPATATAAAE